MEHRFDFQAPLPEGERDRTKCGEGVVAAGDESAVIGANTAPPCSAWSPSLSGRGFLQRLPAYVRYALASGIALGVDLAIFFALYGAHVAPTLATATGYSAGIVAHWLVSSRFVFNEGPAVTGRARHVQKVMFVLTAFVGLVLSVAIVAAGQIVGLDPRLARLVGIIVSFQSGWLLRRGLVFA